MVEKLTWDSKFFKRKIGKLTLTSPSQDQIETAVEKAKGEGFKYLICKIQSRETALIKVLESSGFYLSDKGVIWSIRTDRFIHKDIHNSSGIRKSIKVAAEKDIPMLKEIGKSLFTDSRFYSDPFFSKKEADKLYRKWIENSVKKETADIVFFIPGKGFITCKRSGNTGEIILIGVKPGFRGKGIGSALIGEAMRWFKDKRVNTVSVRTQIKNLKAMNFYLTSGFYIKEHDIVFSKIL